MSIQSVALDIALIPEDAVLLAAERMNEKFRDRDIHLDHSRGIWPHITMTMAIIPRNRLEELILELEKISLKSRLGLSFSEAYLQSISDGRSIAGWNISPHEELRKLHRRLHIHLQNYSEFVPEIEALYFSEARDPQTLDFIKNYNATSALENFKPHITLGFSEQVEMPAQSHFKTQFLGLFQLGNYCTCRELIWRG